MAQWVKTAVSTQGARFNPTGRVVWPKDEKKKKKIVLDFSVAMLKIRYHFKKSGEKIFQQDRFK